MTAYRFCSSKDILVLLVLKSPPPSAPVPRERKQRGRHLISSIIPVAVVINVKWFLFTTQIARVDGKEIKKKNVSNFLRLCPTARANTKRALM